MLILFVPFTVLPPAIWLVVPPAVTVAAILTHRPGWWAWAGMLALLAIDPLQVLSYSSGTPTTWFVMLMAIATHHPWVSAFIVAKPSLLPFGLVGIYDRRWWAVIAGLVLVSLVLLPMTFAWITAMRNVQDAGLFYAFVNVPLMLLPLVACVGRRREAAPDLHAEGGPGTGLSGRGGPGTGRAIVRGEPDREPPVHSPADGNGSAK